MTVMRPQSCDCPSRRTRSARGASKLLKNEGTDGAIRWRAERCGKRGKHASTDPLPNHVPGVEVHKRDEEEEAE